VNAVILGRALLKDRDEEQELWYFSVVDVIEILSDSRRPRKYWSDLKKRLFNEGRELSEKIVQLKMIAPNRNLLRRMQPLPDRVGM